MDLLESLQWRYATKKFDDQKRVDEATVKQLLDATNLAATSYGLQPFRFLVIQNQDLQNQLVASSYGQNQVAEASHVIVIAIRTDIDENYIKNYVALMESERGMPPGTLEQFQTVMIGSIVGMSDDKRKIWAEKQAYIALGTLLAACAVNEIDACPMEGFVPSEYNEMLGLAEKNLHATVVIPIGYRAEDDKYSSYKKIRRPMNEMLIEI